MNLPVVGRRAPSVPRMGLVHASILAMVVLLVASWVFALGLDRQQSVSFFSGETARRAWSFVKELAGTDASAGPAYADAGEWSRVAGLAYDTLAMSVLAISMAAVAALATFMFGARNVMLGELAPHAGWGSHLMFVAVRGSWALVRGVPELVWALLLVFVLSPGILPGAVALAVHNYGVLAKLSSEVVEGMDPRPAQALRAAGAGRMQVLAYGVLPQALPRFLTYLLYRWEVVIRTTIVVGFVAAGGLGMEFRLAMSSFHYSTVTLLLMWYLILVLGVDFISSKLRRLSA
jgi:phosphonate transport system permease protein